MSLLLVRHGHNYSAASPDTSLYASFDTGLTNVQAVFGGGMIRRNSAYAGPALRVANNLNTDEVDIEFDASGRVAGVRPYGNDTRVVRVYDQWGTDDFIALKAVGITIIEEDGVTIYTWQMDFSTATDGLFTVSTAADTPAWATAPHPIWALGHTRNSDTGLLIMHGIRAASNFMALGLWQESADLHWRIDGSAQSDWTGTDWTIDAPASQQFARAIGDMSQRDSIGQAWFNGVDAGSRPYVGPEVDNFFSTSRYGWGSGDISQGGDSDIYSTELHLFDSTAPVTFPEITYIDDALAEVQSISS